MFKLNDVLSCLISWGVASLFKMKGRQGGGGWPEPRGGFFHQNRMWMCLPDLETDYLYTNCLPNFPPISIPFSKEKHPIWIKLGAFYNNLPNIHPIYVIWAPSSLMKTPRSLYQISRKSAPKGRHICVYQVNVRTPPPGPELKLAALHRPLESVISFGGSRGMGFWLRRLKPPCPWPSLTTSLLRFTLDSGGTRIILITGPTLMFFGDRKGAPGNWKMEGRIQT